MCRYPVGDGAKRTRTIGEIVRDRGSPIPDPRSGHYPREKQHQLEDENEDDRQLEEVAAGNGDLLDREPVDVVERLQLLLDAGLPRRQAEAGTGEVEQAGGVDVADHLEGVLRAIGDLVHLDEQRVELVRGADLTASE